MTKQIDELKLKRTAIPETGKTIGQKITDNKYAAEIKELTAQLDKILKQNSCGIRVAISPRAQRAERVQEPKTIKFSASGRLVVKSDLSPHSSPRPANHQSSSQTVMSPKLGQAKKLTNEGRTNSLNKSSNV